MQREFWLDRVERAQTRARAVATTRDAAEKTLAAAQAALAALEDPPAPTSKMGKTPAGRAAIEAHRAANERVLAASADHERVVEAEKAAVAEVVEASKLLAQHGAEEAKAANPANALSFLERRGLGIAAENAMRDPSNQDFGLSVEEARLAKLPGALPVGAFSAVSTFVRQPDRLADERRRGHQEVEQGRFLGPTPHPTRLLPDPELTAEAHAGMGVILAASQRIAQDQRSGKKIADSGDAADGADAEFRVMGFTAGQRATPTDLALLRLVHAAQSAPKAIDKKAAPGSFPTTARAARAALAERKQVGSQSRGVAGSMGHLRVMHRGWKPSAAAAQLALTADAHSSGHADAISSVTAATIYERHGHILDLAFSARHWLLDLVDVAGTTVKQDLARRDKAERVTLSPILFAAYRRDRRRQEEWIREHWLRCLNELQTRRGCDAAALRRATVIHWRLRIDYQTVVVNPDSDCLSAEFIEDGEAAAAIDKLLAIKPPADPLQGGNA